MRIGIVLLALAVALLASVFILDYTGTLGSFFSLDEDGIRDLIRDRYPESEPIINHTQNCTLCSGGDCEDYGSPCWRVMVIEGENESMRVTEFILGPSGSTRGSETKPCTGWWCGADPCQYTRTESKDGASFSYTNLGCGSSELSCDQAYDRCRPCELGRECIATIESTQGGVTTYRYEVLRTGEHAEISDTEGVCRIYSRGSIIHEEPMDPEGCGSLMKENTQCYEGTCDFVPGFDLIPG